MRVAALLVAIIALVLAPQSASAAKLEPIPDSGSVTPPLEPLYVPPPSNPIHLSFVVRVD